MDFYICYGPGRKNVQCERLSKKESDKNVNYDSRYRNNQVTHKESNYIMNKYSLFKGSSGAKSPCAERTSKRFCYEYL